MTTDIDSVVLTTDTTYELRAKTVRELVDGFYEDDLTGHVEGFGGKLDIRPAYQRA